MGSSFHKKSRLKMFQAVKVIWSLLISAIVTSASWWEGQWGSALSSSPPGSGLRGSGVSGRAHIRDPLLDTPRDTPQMCCIFLKKLPVFLKFCSPLFFPRAAEQWALASVGPYPALLCDVPVGVCPSGTPLSAPLLF